MRLGTRSLPALAVLAATTIGAAPARADVLVSALPRHVACGKDIRFGVWYQRYSGGPRWAKLSVRAADGRVVFRKRVRATTRWRYYRFHPRCGRTYRARYVVPGGKATYRVSVGRP